MRKSPDPLHERPAAADLVGQPAEVDGHLLATAHRVLQADGLEQGEIHQVVACLVLRKRAWPLTRLNPDTARAPPAHAPNSTKPSNT